MESVSRASATGNPRNKTALKPGRSLMDWIRLTNSSTDLTGGGGLRDVTAEELARHNSREDAWLAIRGMVYNVTAYFEFHPGGEDELIKGAGIDATDLFDSVHKWVNYESMLKKCLIGRLKGDVLPVTTTTNAIKKRSSGNGGLLFTAPSISTGVTTDWMQSPTKVTLIFYTRQKGLDTLCVSTALEDGELRVRITNAERKCWDYKVRPFAPLDPASRQLNLSSSTGKVELSYNKVRENVHWPSVGQAEGEQQQQQLFRAPNLVYFRTAKLGHKVKVTRNVYLFEMRFSSGHEFLVPVGWHVQIKLILDDGSEVIRSYTPVPRDLKSGSVECPSRIDSALSLYFLIKIYPEGPFTSRLEQMVEGSCIHVSEPIGTYEAPKWKEDQQLVCIAAGTGITPMIRPILGALMAGRRVTLLFFNRERMDIIWDDLFHQLELDHNEKFKVWRILSEPDDEWTGLRGRISPAILASTFHPICNASIYICGPNEFTLETIRLLDELEYKSEQIHAFSG